MSERLHHTPERNAGSIDTSVESKRNLERLQEEAHKDRSEESVDTLKHKAEAIAKSGKETTVGERQEASRSSIGIQKDLKNTAYRKTLSRVQDQLSTPQRAFSKVIHQPVVEQLSNVGSRTIARPSGVMGGGLFALLGGGLVLYFSKRYGFEYNYLLFAMLFAAGFAAGLAIELTLKLAVRRQDD